MSISLPPGTCTLVLTPEKLRALWETFSGISGLLDDYGKGRFDIFVSKFCDPDSIWLECTDFPGVVYATGIRAGLSAFVHFTFLDRKLRGREQFLLDVLQWLVNMLQLEKVNCFVPDYCRTLLAFLGRLGFTTEGKIRNWSRHDGQLFSVVALGMTKEEVNGRVFPTADERIAVDPPIAVGE